MLSPSILNHLKYSGDASTYSPSSFLVPLSPLPTDFTFTLHNVTTAVESVEDWKLLVASLGVPDEKRGSREEMLQYFIAIVPNSSWQTLAGHLYYRQEHAALERVTKYFQPQPGMGGWGLSIYCNVLRSTAINSFTFTRW